MTILAGRKARASDFRAAYFHGYQVTPQNLATSALTWTSITLDGELVDTIGGHSVASNTSRYTPNLAGYYQVWGHVALSQSDLDGDRAIRIAKNGAAYGTGAPYSGVRPPVSAAILFGFAWTFATVALNGSTDYVELQASQNSGSTLPTIVTAATTSIMICEWKAPL